MRPLENICIILTAGARIACENHFKTIEMVFFFFKG
jgi:hypothetical protein